MHKIILSFKRSFICILLSLSLVCTNTAATTYQAAALPITFSLWEIFVTVFALMGICLEAAPDYSDDDAAQELLTDFTGWRVLNGFGKGDNDGDGQDDLFSTFDPMEWIFGDRLKIPEDEWEILQKYYQDKAADPAKFMPVDNTDISKMNYQDFCDWFYPHLNIESYSSWSKVSSFCQNVYDTLSDNDFSGIIFKSKSSNSFGFTTLNNYDSSPPVFSWYESANGSDAYNFFKYSSTYYKYQVGQSYCANLSIRDKNTDCNYNYYKSSSSLYFTSQYDFVAFIINGRLYDTSIFTYPVNATTSLDHGAQYALTDFLKPVHNIGDALTDFTNSIGNLDLSEMINNGSYDVITDGRDYDSDNKDVTGDVTVTIPSTDVITDYQNGLITYEELLEKLGAIPVDKNEGVNLLTQEFLDTQTGIFNGVNSLVNLVTNIFDFLSNMIGNFISALVEMFAGLFVPSPGYFEAYFSELNALFEGAFGFLYTPFDFLFSFLGSLSNIGQGSTQLYFPGIKFQEYVLCEPMYVELDLSDEVPGLYRYMHFITNTILIGAVLWLLQTKAKEVVVN